MRIVHLRQTNQILARENIEFFSVTHFITCSLIKLYTETLSLRKKYNNFNQKSYNDNNNHATRNDGSLMSTRH